MNVSAKDPRVVVIIPAHNESSRIGRVITSIRAALPAADVVVINDGSTDRTQGEALAAGAMVLPHITNLGYGAALETGYFYALHTDCDVVLQMDGDGQHLVEELPRLLAPLVSGEADLVLGSRFLHGAKAYHMPLLKRLGQRLFSILLRSLTGTWFTDPTSGFQGLNRKAIQLFASGVFPCDYPDADVLLMAHLCGLRIREVPVRMLDRSGGKSMHSGWAPVYYGMKMFLSMFIVLLNYGTWRKWRQTLNRSAATPPPKGDA